MLMIVGSMIITSQASAQMEGTHAVPSIAQSVGQLRQEDVVNNLLDKYFSRIDSYLQENQYHFAKNELEKIHLIDTNNPHIKEYEQLISKKEQEWLKENKSKITQEKALLVAEKELLRKQKAGRFYGRLMNKSEVTDADRGKGLQDLDPNTYKAKRITEAKKYLDRGDYDKAISCYRDALDVDPGDMKVCKLLNKALKRREDRWDRIGWDTEQMKKGTQEGTDDYVLESSDYEHVSVEAQSVVALSIDEKMQIPITATFRDVDLLNVLDLLSDYTDLNIIASQYVAYNSIRISVRFKELPLERALKYIIEGLDLTFRVDDNVIYIATEEEIAHEKFATRVYYIDEDSGSFSTLISSALEGTKSLAWSASLSSMQSIEEFLKDTIPFPTGSKIEFNDMTGALAITNTLENLKRVEDVLPKIHF